jgi:serine/threonine protein kinase
MLIEEYEICSNQIGNGHFGKVYKIKKVEPPFSILIGKIFEPSNREIYEKEKYIFSKLNNDKSLDNDYLVQISQNNIHLSISDIVNFNSRYLVFEDLFHGALCDYLYILQDINKIKEKYVKLICYKLLKALKKCHENDICHNKIDIKNIMLDKDFNPKIIHFSEATLDNKSYKKDFVGLGLVLAKLITSGYFNSIGYSKKQNAYFIKTNNVKNSKNLLEESIFWNLIETTHNIKVSKEFKAFFDNLLKSKNDLNINELINNEWLKEVEINQNKIEKNFKKDFEKYYNIIIDSKKCKIFDIDLSSILEKRNEPEIYYEPKELNCLSSYINSEKYEADSLGEKSKE